MYYALQKFINNEDKTKQLPSSKNNMNLLGNNENHNNIDINTNTNTNISSVWTFYYKGAIAGMTGILLSHPVDTIKTHIQFGKILRDFQFGIRNLYRGLLPPLVGVGMEKAIVFGTYNFFNRYLDNIPIAGGIAGLTASCIVTPYERLKILKQNNIGINKAELSLKFLFRGLSATWTREVPGFAIYFSVYEYLKYTRHTRYGNEIGYTNAFIYGGLSGIAAWIFIYPQDRIKTILQSSISSNNSNSIKKIILEIYNKGGLKHFYSGFSWAVARAILLHSGTFCMMEFLITPNEKKN